MAIFSGGDKPGGFNALMERVRTRAYSGEQELVALLNQIFTHPDARPKKLVWMLTSPNPTVRDRSAGMIGKMAGHALCDVLIHVMGESSSQARKAFAQEIVKVEPQKLMRVLGSLGVSKEAGERLIAVEIVAEHPRWTDYMALIKRALTDPDGSIRLAGINVLARAPENPTVRLILIRQLESADPTVRMRAIDILSRSPDADLVEPFFAHMPAADSHERRLMADCLAKLARNPSSKMEEHVLPVLADENADMRAAGVQLLAEMPNRTKVLRAFFIHSRGLATWLRTRTTQSILQLADSLVENLRELLEDEDIDVRVGAMLMISDSNSHSFIPLVVKMFHSDLDWWIRSIAIDVLAKYPSPQIVQLLLQELGNPDLRYSIISALGKIGGSMAQGPLLSCLQDPSRGIRIAVLKALAKHPTDEIVQRIYVAARDDPEKKVREQAAALLVELGASGEVYCKDLEARERTAEETATSDHGLTMVNDDLNR